MSAHTSQDNHTRALPPLVGAADLFWLAQPPVTMITIPIAMMLSLRKVGQHHIWTSQDGEKLNNVLSSGAPWLSIRTFCWRWCPSAIWGEYLWRWPRFYGKISTGRDSHVPTIWRGTPAKYDLYTNSKKKLLIFMARSLEEVKAMSWYCRKKGECLFRTLSMCQRDLSK